jgi:outer membrane protein assembly factor BamB
MTTPRKPLRLWPGVAGVAILLIMMFVVPAVVPDSGAIGFLGGLAAGLIVLLWWLFFSRARWSERLLVLAFMVGAAFVTKRLIHVSIENGGMGFLFYAWVVPALAVALVLWAVAARRLEGGARFTSMVVAIVLGCATLTLIRTGGMSGGAGPDLHWRWTPTPEELLLAGKAPSASSTHTTGSGAEPASADWPGFRGPERNSVVRGAKIETDWSRKPPVEMWRRPVGPAWSSFAVRGDRIFTQEQRGEDELVSCYDLNTGEPVWEHRDATRFWESNAGAGPRGTPTLSDDRVYSFGGTGIVNALDLNTGSVVWTRNAATDTKKSTPHWGFSSSPLVVGDLVVVAVAGKPTAYDRATGELRWIGPKGGGYSSPQLLTIDGVQQIVVMNGIGAVGVAPADGAVLWQHDWGNDGIVQPNVTEDGDLLLGTATGMGSGAGVGVRRLAVEHGGDGWTVTERWTTNGLKPYFNDFVVHKGHAFGFDGSRLSCIELAAGQRKWKGGHYGPGQMVLLADQDLLLVVAEQGDLALVAASPDQFKELARVPAIQGKTWNHPVLVGNVLLVRNAEEMAAFRL